jgi:hypothetical protein
MSPSDPITREHFDATVVELKALIASLARQPGIAAVHTDELVDAAAAMTIMGYTDRDAFNRAARRERITRVRFNARKYGYHRSDLARWLQVRRVKGS